MLVFVSKSKPDLPTTVCYSLLLWAAFAKKSDNMLSRWSLWPISMVRKVRIDSLRKGSWSRPPKQAVPLHMHSLLCSTECLQTTGTQPSRSSINCENSGVPEDKTLTNDHIYGCNWYTFMPHIKTFFSYTQLEKYLTLISPLMSFKFPKEGNWKEEAERILLSPYPKETYCY